MYFTALCRNKAGNLQLIITLFLYVWSRSCSRLLCRWENVSHIYSWTEWTAISSLIESIERWRTALHHSDLLCVYKKHFHFKMTALCFQTYGAGLSSDVQMFWSGFSPHHWSSTCSCFSTLYWFHSVSQRTVRERAHGKSMSVVYIVLYIHSQRRSGSGSYSSSQLMNASGVIMHKNITLCFNQILTMFCALINTFLNYFLYIIIYFNF